MATKKTKNARLPVEFLKDMELSLDARYKNNLITRKDLKLSEGFRLIRRMPEWEQIQNKLKKLPKKEDVL